MLPSEYTVTNVFSNEDVDQLLNLERQAFPRSEWTAEDFIESRDNYRWQVVKNGARVVAYIATDVPSTKRKNPEIYAVAVHDDYRGDGIGSHLIGLEEDLCFGQGYNKIQLKVRVDNIKAQWLYLRRGYEFVKRLYEWFDGDDAILMVKKLKGE